MAPASIGLETPARPSGQVRLGFRAGWVRSVAVKVGGAGLVGLGLAAFSLAREQPAQVFDLLSKWGFVWILGLVAMLLAWDLAKLALGYLSKLADSVQETAVAMNRIADKDDRERDRMVTETAFVGQRLQRMAEQHEEWKVELRAHNQRVEEMLAELKTNKT